MGHFFANDPHLLIFLCHHQNHLVVREIEGVVCSRSPGLINPYPPGSHNLGSTSSKNSWRPLLFYTSHIKYEVNIVLLSHIKYAT